MIRALCSLIAIVSAVFSQTAVPPSPCPNVFTYEPPGPEEKSGSKKWYGVVNLSTDITLHALFLNIVLDSKADILGNWLGEVTTEDNFNFKIENTKQKIVPGQPLAVRFFVQYTLKKIPRVESILFNGREICNADKAVAENPAQTVSNYSLSSGGYYERTDRTSSTTTVRTTTLVSTKYVYSKSQTTNQNKQTTTSKPNYWTVPQAATVQTTTEKSKTKFETRSENKGNVALGIGNQQTKNQTQTTSGNISQVRPNTQTSGYQPTSGKLANTTQNKPQVTYGSTSSHKPQLWSDVKTENTEQVLPANKHQVVADNTNYQSWSGSKFENNQQTRSDDKPLNPSRVDSFGITTGNQGNQERPKVQTRPEDKSHITGDTQYYGQSNVNVYEQGTEVNRPENRFQDSSYVQPQDTQVKQQSNVNTGSRHQPVRENNVPTNVITVSFQVPEDKASAPTRTINLSIPPTWSEGRVEVNPISSKDDTVSKSWSKDKPTIIYGSISSRYNENDGIRDENVHRPSSYGFDKVPVEPAPVIEYHEDSNQKDEEDEFFSGGLPVFIPNINTEPKCGKVVKKPPRVLPYGSTTSEGQWPWQAAIYQQRSVNFKYICGGTLVSERHVITAAHCVTKRKNVQLVNKNTLTVYLGKFNLRTSVEGVQVKLVNRIIVHPQYNASTYSRDLAILVLRDSAEITDWVRPACLWPEDEVNLSSIVGKKGSVVGWGTDSAGVPKAELNLLEMPVVNQDVCISSYNIYERFTSAHSYCARYKDDTDTCNGDSGGGMVFKKGNTWYLRGLVSISVTTQHEYLCDPKHYIIFTDVAKFLPWIFDQIDM